MRGRAIPTRGAPKEPSAVSNRSAVRLAAKAACPTRAQDLETQSLQKAASGKMAPGVNEAAIAGGHCECALSWLSRPARPPWSCRLRKAPATAFARPAVHTPPKYAHTRLSCNAGCSASTKNMGEGVPLLSSGVRRDDHRLEVQVVRPPATPTDYLLRPRGPRGASSGCGGSSRQRRSGGQRRPSSGGRAARRPHGTSQTWPVRGSGGGGGGLKANPRRRTCNTITSRGGPAAVDGFCGLAIRLGSIRDRTNCFARRAALPRRAGCYKLIWWKLAGMSNAIRSPLGTLSLGSTESATGSSGF